MTDPIAQLLAQELASPHDLLGAHERRDDVVVRAYRPAAESVAVVTNGSKVAGEQIADGLFEATLPKASLPLEYELEIAYPDGNSFTLPDPYRFLPTLGDVDLHLIGEGRHEALYDKLGAHVLEIDGVVGTAFAVWAPSARSVSVVGEFNSWDGRLHPMRALGASGVWELFVPGVEAGQRYKYEIHAQSGELRLKADPLAQRAQLSPETDSIVTRSSYEWTDQDWMEKREKSAAHREAMSVYEVHLASWRRDPGDPERILSYSELGDQLSAYCVEMGFTHVELLPVMQHPFSGSWGYQVTGYFAPDARHGTPDDFRSMVDTLHRAGIGVILDWVPAHFPRDDWALARFDGSALYEHEDPRRGAHKDWGTLIFNTGRNEVRNFLIASALYWLKEMHCDGLRVDAVASMLYLDYSREEGEWVPNEFGGREDLDAIGFLKQLNETVYGAVPGTQVTAEESTAFPGVSRPVYLGGLGFGLKWNMGWMHDTLAYFGEQTVYRRYHHHELTFSLVYAFSENFVLPLSHDEVVHGKGTILTRMPGDRWQQLANVRSLYAYQWAHPGKQLLFMGQEYAQEQEWKHDQSLDWHLLSDDGHAGVKSLVAELNDVYKQTPALWERDSDHTAFQWLEANDADNNVVAFIRYPDVGGDPLVCVCNLSPSPRESYRVGMPRGGAWREVLNTDASQFGGAGLGNGGGATAEDVPWHGQSHSAVLTLPPLAVLWLLPG